MPFAITISFILTTNDNRFCFEIPRKNVANVYTVYTYSQLLISNAQTIVQNYNWISYLRYASGMAKFWQNIAKQMMKIAFDDNDRSEANGRNVFTGWQFEFNRFCLFAFGIYIDVSSDQWPMTEMGNTFAINVMSFIQCWRGKAPK